METYKTDLNLVGFTAKEDIREALQYIKIGKEFVEATDGYVAIRVGSKIEGFEHDILIKNETVKDIVRKSNQPMVVIEEKDERYEFTVVKYKNISTVVQQKVNLTMPEHDKIFESARKEEYGGAIWMSVSLMVQVFSGLKKITDQPVKMSFPKNNLKPLLIEGKTFSGNTFKCLVMPFRPQD